jgi:hypothetical protein
MTIHLPNEQTVFYEDGEEEEAIEKDGARISKLTQWFELNKRDPDAREMLYCEVGKKYVWARNDWKPRQVMYLLIYIYVE